MDWNDTFTEHYFNLKSFMTLVQNPGLVGKQNNGN